LAGLAPLGPKFAGLGLTSAASLATLSEDELAQYGSQLLPRWTPDNQRQVGRLVELARAALLMLQCPVAPCGHLSPSVRELDRHLAERHPGRERGNRA
jgi:hypothetical protein